MLTAKQDNRLSAAETLAAALKKDPTPCMIAVPFGERPSAPETETPTIPKGQAPAWTLCERAGAPFPFVARRLNSIKGAA